MGSNAETYVMDRNKAFVDNKPCNHLEFCGIVTDIISKERGLKSRKKPFMKN